jgi:hypothetical protein
MRAALRDGEYWRWRLAVQGTRLSGDQHQRFSHAWWMAWLLPLLAAGLSGSPPPRAALAADRRPADDLAPTVADVRAHATLTAAPPRSRVPVLAGAAA